MDRIFLAITISALLLMIGAAGLNVTKTDLMPTGTIGAARLLK